MMRTVPVTDRITIVSVSITCFRNLTPDTRAPVVTPVAANRQSPFTISSIEKIIRGSVTPIRTALALLIGVEHQAALHLAADTAQRGCRQHALGSTTGTRTHTNIDTAIFRIRGVNDAGDVAITDQAHGGAGAAH